jgi:hypothetical protein
MAAASNPEAQQWSGDFVNQINEQVRVCSFAEMMRFSECYMWC